MNICNRYIEPVPQIDFPEITDYQIELSDEPLVDLCHYSSERIICENQYYEKKIAGSINCCLVRKDVADRLKQVLLMLPDGYSLKIFDAWRPYEVQYHLYYDYFGKLVDSGNYDSYTVSELKNLAKEFVSYPQKTDISYVHSSGGAIDLTIVDSDGCPLDMGSEFDDFSDKSNTSYFESSRIVNQACVNRRLLYHLMIKNGFTNLPSEWWHFDYGDLFWSYYTGQPVKYQSIF